MYMLIIIIAALFNSVILWPEANGQMKIQEKTKTTLETRVRRRKWVCLKTASSSYLLSL